MLLISTQKCSKLKANFCHRGAVKREPLLNLPGSHAKMKQQLPLLTAKCTAQSAKASISQWKTVLVCSFTLFRGVTPKQTKK